MSLDFRLRPGNIIHLINLRDKKILIDNVQRKSSLFQKKKKKHP
jgi:hypothetical protein